MRTILLVALAIGLLGIVAAPTAAAHTTYCDLGDLQCWAKCQTHKTTAELKGETHPCYWNYGPPPT